MPQPFTAIVSNASNTAVNWSVNGIPGGTAQLGTITSAGVYMAPAIIPAGAITVTAISQADPVKVSNATVTFVDQVTISLTPPSSTVTLPGTQQFTATVNVTNNAVTWAVNGFVGGSSLVGTVSDSGLYTSPASGIPAGLIEVTATSQADITRRASAGITLQYAPIALTTVSPPTAAETDWGATVTMTLIGTGFGGFTVVAVRDLCGLPEPVSGLRVVSMTEIEFSARLPLAGDYVITVSNPSPGGTAASLPFRLSGINSAIMVRPRLGHTSTLLQDGRILVAGGLSCTNGSVTSTAEIFDPATLSFTATSAPMKTPRFAHAATLLPNGSVLITGGSATQDLSAILDSAELYDPTTDTFTPTGNLAGPRREHTSTLLPDGKVLIVGGRRLVVPVTIFFTYEAVPEAEIYDPPTGTLAPSGSLNFARHFHSATLLPDGRMLIAGGWGANGTAPGDITEPTEIATAEIFEPQTQLFSPSADLAWTRISHTDTLLSGSRVLLTGGITGIGRFSGAVIYAEIFDAATGTFESPIRMTSGRFRHGINLLPSGRYLLTGGSTGVLTNELFDVTAAGFLLTLPTRSGHLGHHPFQLPDGRIILIGGLGGGPDKMPQAAEIITPP